MKEYNAQMKRPNDNQIAIKVTQFEVNDVLRVFDKWHYELTNTVANPELTIFVLFFRSKIIRGL